MSGSVSNCLQWQLATVAMQAPVVNVQVTNVDLHPTTRQVFMTDANAPSQ